MNSDASDAFEKGAGATPQVVSNLFEMMLSGALFIALLVIVLGSYLAWRKNSISLEDFSTYSLRGLAFFIFVVSFIWFT